jgi:hypothetical protein
MVLTHITAIGLLSDVLNLYGHFEIATLLNTRAMNLIFIEQPQKQYKTDISTNNFDATIPTEVYRCHVLVLSQLYEKRLAFCFNRKDTDRQKYFRMNCAT